MKLFGTIEEKNLTCVRQVTSDMYELETPSEDELIYVKRVLETYGERILFRAFSKKRVFFEGQISVGVTMSAEARTCFESWQRVVDLKRRFQ